MPTSRSGDVARRRQNAEERAPLFGDGRGSVNSQADLEYSYDAGDLEAEGAVIVKRRSMWVRMWFLGVLFMLVSFVGGVGLLALAGVWISLLVCLVWTVIAAYLAQHPLRFFFGARRDDAAILRTIGQVMLLAAFFGAYGGVGSGVFLRPYWQAYHGRELHNVATTDPARHDGGRFYFNAGARPYGNLAAVHRSVGGLFVVCAAPILEGSAQRETSYWAVGSGKCCLLSPANCGGWTTAAPNGAIQVVTTEVFPDVAKAVDASASANRITALPHRLMMRWGNPTQLMEDEKRMTILVSATTLGFGALIMLAISLRRS